MVLIAAIQLKMHTNYYVLNEQWHACIVSTITADNKVVSPGYIA